MRAMRPGCPASRNPVGIRNPDSITPQESTSLIAKADGIDRHAEGELPSANVWRWQEITGLEFLRYLARSGRVGG